MSGIYDEFFENIVNEMKKEYPESLLFGEETAKYLISLPLPSLSLRYLFQQEGLPLGRFITIVGEQESCKSSFSYEIIRWHRLLHGFGIIIDTEIKPAPDLMWSILNYDKHAVAYYTFPTLEEWCSCLTNNIKLIKTKMDGEGRTKGIGRKIPFCFVIDSIMSGLPKDDYSKLIKEGIPEKRYATHALLLTEYIRFITKELEGYPFTLIGINHLKPGITPMGLPSRNIAGGKALKFHEAIEIEMRRKSSVNPTSKNVIQRYHDDELVQGIELQICIFKNSNAPHEWIDVDMLWYLDKDNSVEVETMEDGKLVKKQIHRQVTFFDWPTSTVLLLGNILRSRTKAASDLADILDLNFIETRRTCYSSTFNIDKTDAVPYHVMGQLIEEKIQNDPSFANDMYSILNIRRRYLFKPGIDYRDQMKEASELNKSIMRTNKGTSHEES